MVPLTTPTDLLSARLEALRQVVVASYDDAGAQSQGFAIRVAGDELPVTNRRPDWGGRTPEGRYGGVPELSILGYMLGAQPHDAADEPIIRAFLAGLGRLRGRTTDVIQEFTGDDLAVLGIADGLHALARTDANRAAPFVSWLVAVLDEHPGRPSWTERARSLAVDLLVERGLVRSKPARRRHDAMALELVLRRAWPKQFQRTEALGDKGRQRLLTDLLTSPIPEIGDLDRAVVWLKALKRLVTTSARALLPTIDETVELLRATAGSFKRWAWEQKAARRGVAPARWLIDSEPHVQAFLYAVLHPVFQEHLRDEEYLPGHGQLQPRYDLGITNLQLLVEVKVARHPRDFSKIEEEIAGDLGLYFEDPNRFNRLIVYVYDDCDEHKPERYDTLRNALRNRDARIVDVIIVRRPSMIPDRTARG